MFSWAPLLADNVHFLFKLYYYSVENFLNHSQYLTTVCPSTFYGEGF